MAVRVIVIVLAAAVLFILLVGVERDGCGTCAPRDDVEATAAGR